MDKNLIKEVINKIIQIINDYKEDNKIDFNSIVKEFKIDHADFSNDLKNNLINPKDLTKNNLKNFVDTFIKIIEPNNYDSLVKSLKNKDMSDIEYILSDLNFKSDKDIKPKPIINIIEDAERTYLLNGTNDTSNRFKLYFKKILANNYFLSVNDNLDSNLSTEEYASDSILKSNSSSFYPWPGDNLKSEMEIYAEAIANDIKARNEFPINLVGHSHGGNIMVQVINKLFDKQILTNDNLEKKISNFITLSTPVRSDIQFYSINLDAFDDDATERSTINPNNITIDLSKLNHICIFSRYDFVQQVGYIDNNEYFQAIVFAIVTGFLGLIPELCGAFGHHCFKDARIKFDFTDYYSFDYLKQLHDDIVCKVKKIFNSYKYIYCNDVPFPYHQATRSVNFVKSILKP